MDEFIDNFSGRGIGIEMNMDFIRTEIGSEYWDVPTCEYSNSLWPADTHWFISGTSALEYIVRDIQKNTRLERVGIPSYCCSCMIHPFVNAELTVVFYPVYLDNENRLVCDYSLVSDCDATLVISYFGFDQTRIIGTPGGILIRDLTHSLFCREYDDAQYYFGSLRKWAGLWTGGYAWKKRDWLNLENIPPADISYLQYRSDAMRRKAAYLKGKTDTKDYLKIFEKAEDFLDQCGIMGSCERDIHCACKLDIEYIRYRRRENAQVLLENLKKMALFTHIYENDCPLFFPILLPNQECRDKLRQYLISREIYCPVHWPISDLHLLDAKERDLYERSLSVVCDQRYNTEDMMRIVEIINMFNT